MKATSKLSWQALQSGRDKRFAEVVNILTLSVFDTRVLQESQLRTVNYH